MKKTKPIYWPALIVSILIAQSAGIIGSIFTTDAIPTWYATLTKPPWNPPSWLFGPVWITLYTLIGLAAYLIWQTKKSTQRTTALRLYAVHLVLNTLWSILFFGLQNPLIAFIEIIFLWILILLVILKFYSLRPLAGIILLPYLAWVSFASLLNATIWLLN